MSTENNAPTAEDFAKLKANRDAILAEKRQLKGELEALQQQLSDATAGFDAERQALTVRAETAEKRVRDYEINYPVSNFLADIASDVQTFRHVFGENYQFGLADGDVAVLDLEGNPVKMDDGKGGKRLVRLNRKDFEQLLYPQGERSEYQQRFAKLLVASRASGGNAMAAGKGSYSASTEPLGKPAAAPTAAPRFGLGRRYS